MSTDSVKELIFMANRLEDDDPQKMSLCEQAIRLADQGNDVKEKYDARIALIETASFSGHPEKALVNFGWCIAQCEKQPELFPLPEILWKYKYVIGCAISFHTIDKEKLEKLIANMENHYSEAGYSLRPVYYVRAFLYTTMGEYEKALDSLQTSKGFERDRFADCQACEIDLSITILIGLKQYKAALEAAEGLLHKKIGCAEVPNITLAELLVATTQLGLDDLGRTYLTNGYQLIKTNPEFLYHVGLQLQYCADHDLIETGLDRLQAHFHWLLETQEHRGKLQFEMGAALLMQAAVLEDRAELVLNLPNTFDCYKESGLYDSQVLLNYFKEQAEVTAKAFDQRNDNNFHEQRLIEKFVTKETLVPI